MRRSDSGDFRKKTEEKTETVIEILCWPCYNNTERQHSKEEIPMKHIQTLNGATLKASAAKGGCGECQTSCQSACKTSCTVANQKCENR